MKETDFKTFFAQKTCMIVGTNCICNTFTREPLSDDFKEIEGNLEMEGYNYFIKLQMKRGFK